ncbi:MAG TPA: c-type cytochrome domain-containing protein [Chthoniobacteraceae bacterium]|jgi:hypothetical protein|nr:c-type cytochrome domain-containing protein [Chthoniobacteraceae bacterium]
MPSKRPLFIVAAALLTAGAAHAAVDFKKEVLPLIENHCLKCHRATHEENGKTVKPKGDLRLDAAWALLKGHKDIVPIKPKDAVGSDMVRVTSLPRDDDEAMPPKDKGEPLAPAEIATLKAWIAEGANFGGWEGNVEGRPAGTVGAVKPPAKERAHDLLYAKLSEGVKEPASEALERAKAAGAQAAPLAPGSPLLRVDFLTAVARGDDAAVAALAPLAEQIAHLDLARTNVTDAACQEIARMRRLTRLDLRDTKITDAGIAKLAALENLVSINLYGAPVTDEALATLAKMKSLKSICVAETKVTEAGRKKLEAALPEAQIAANLEFPATPAKAATKKK